MKLKTTLTALALGLASAGAFAQVVGVSWSNFQEERWKTDEKAIKDQLAKLGASYISADAGGSPEKQLADIDSKRVAQRLVGYTDLSHRPTADSYLKLIAAESEDEHAQRGGQPYPFFLAHALQAPTEQFDALLWFEQTQPVTALPLPKQQHLEPEDETYPFGV